MRLRSIAPYAVSIFLSALFSLLSILLFSRLLSADGYGIYSTALTLATLCQIVGFSWIQASVVRFHADLADEADRSRLAGAVRVGFGLSAIAASIVWIIGFAASGISVGGAALGAAGLAALLLRSWAGFGESWNRALERPWRFTLSQGVQAAGALLFALIGFSVRPGDPLVIFLAAAAASLLCSVLAPALLGGERQPWRRLKPILVQMWKYGAPLTIISLGLLALAAFDRLLIMSILGPAAAGAYSASSGLAYRALAVLLAPIAAAIKPVVFARYSQDGAEAASRLLEQAGGWLVAIGLPVTVLLVCAPDAFTSVIIGKELAGAAAEVLPWTAIAALLSTFLTLHFGLGFQIVRRTQRMIWVLAPAVAFDLLSNILLLPRFGIVAAGWCAAASYSIALVLVVWQGRQYFQVPFPVVGALRTAAACIPLVAFAQLEFPRSPLGLALLLAGGALVYAVSALAWDVAGSRGYLVRGLQGLRTPSVRM